MKISKNLTIFFAGIAGALLGVFVQTFLDRKNQLAPGIFDNPTWYGTALFVGFLFGVFTFLCNESVSKWLKN